MESGCGEKRFHCEHCGEKISRSLYFEHKRLYYSSNSSTWKKELFATGRDQQFKDFVFPEEDTPEDDNSIEVESSSLYGSEPNDSELNISEPSTKNGSDSETDFNFDDDEIANVEVWFDDPEEYLAHKSNPTENPILKTYVMFLLKWQSLFRVSDTAMNILLRFIAGFIGLLVITLSITALKELADELPHSVSNAKKFIGNHRDEFIKYASCSKCDSIYPLSSCTEGTGANKSSKMCSYKKFPQHPQPFRRKACNFPLMKRVRTSAGTITLHARRTFCYRSLTESLKNLLKRPNFLVKCEEWRSRQVPVGILKDIYDGQVWKNFMNPDSIPFLYLPYNFALSINIDWFQPYKHSTYSLGAMYISILNLPRSERYNTENVILIGIIPGPREPQKTMNTYLRPLVDELKTLWNGVIMECINGNSVIVCAALLCTACDIPASRKVSGFVGFNAYHACSKCLKTFPTAAFGEQPDYSGFDRELWPPRSLDSHINYAEQYRNATTASRRKSIEKEGGCRYSILLELPYYDIIQYCIVDPMHNLLLGTAKRMLTIWKTNGVIDESKFDIIQAKVDTYVTPADVGRIPGKISSGFAGFTAEQWRNWTLIYSLCCLKDVLPYKHYDCWLLFVKATSLLCRRKITLKELNDADLLLLEFCSTFETLYGRNLCTINLHLHGHLKECILDFGPVYAFWLFSFERLNGILGSYHTNGHSISVQIMRKYLSNEYHNIYNWPKEFKEQFAPLLFAHQYSKGSLLSQTAEECLMQSNNVEPLPPVHEVAWEQHQKLGLNDLIASYVGHEDYVVLTLYKKATALSASGFIIGSSQSRFVTTSHVMAAHPAHGGTLYLAKIEHFAKIDVRDKVKNANCSIWTACVSFYFEHECKVWFGGPTQVWSRAIWPELYYISISSIKTRVAYCECDVNFGRRIGHQNVLVVSLLSNYSN